jgi:hypothetical protein
MQKQEKWALLFRHTFYPPFSNFRAVIGESCVFFSNYLLSGFAGFAGVAGGSIEILLSSVQLPRVFAQQ